MVAIVPVRLRATNSAISASVMTIWLRWLVPMASVCQAHPRAAPGSQSPCQRLGGGEQVGPSASGRQPIRSIGPETGPRRSPHRCGRGPVRRHWPPQVPVRPRSGPAAAATPASARDRSVNFAAGSTACAVALSPNASSTLAPEPAVIGSRVPTGTVSRSQQPVPAQRCRLRWCPPAGRAAHSPVISRSRGSTAALAASSGSWTWAASSVRAGPSSQRPCRPGRGAGALPARRQPMRGGARQAGAIAQFGQPAWRLGDRVQHTHRFVEHADTAILSHIEILASRNVR